MKITQEIIDKAKYYLEKYPDMPKEDIAAICGCSGTTIRNIANVRYDTGVYVELSPWHEGSHKKKPEQTDPQEVCSDAMARRLEAINDGLHVANLFLASITACLIDAQYGDMDKENLVTLCKTAQRFMVIKEQDDD